MLEIRDGWSVQEAKTITWYDPAALAAAATELPGREFLQAIIDGRLPPPPIANLFGAELVAVGDREALFRCTPDASTYNPIGMVHGGLLCTLLDSAAGCAVHTRPRPAPATLRSRSRSATSSRCAPTKGRSKSLDERCAWGGASRSPRRTLATRTVRSSVTRRRRSRSVA